MKLEKHNANKPLTNEFSANTIFKPISGNMKTINVIIQMRIKLSISLNFEK